MPDSHTSLGIQLKLQYCLVIEFNRIKLYIHIHIYHVAAVTKNHLLKFINKLLWNSKEILTYQLADDFNIVAL